MTTFFTHKKTKKSFIGQIPLVLGLLGMSYSTLATAAESSAPLTGQPIGLTEIAEIALNNSPTILTQRLTTVDIAKAKLMMAASAFDIYTSVSLNASRARPFDGTGNMDNQALTASISKAFRSGVSTTFSVNNPRVDSRGVDAPTYNSSSLSFSVNVPLLKGSGYVGSAAADETAARLNSEASLFRFYDVISQTLIAAIGAYWDYKVAVVNLDYKRDSEQRVQEWLTEVQNNNGSSPQATRLQTTLADKKRATIDATERVSNTKSALGVAIGIPAAQVDQIGSPKEEFPMNWSKILAHFNEAQAGEKWVAVALAKRFDLQATKLDHEAVIISLAQAKRNVLPSLDLSLTAGRDGTKMGNGFGTYMNSFNTDTGTNTGIGLNFSYPIGNQLARGSLDIAKVSHQVSLFQLNDLKRRIDIDVRGNAGTVMRNLQAVEQANDAIGGYLSALSKYKTTLTSSLSDPNSVFNLLKYEDDWVKLTENQIQALLTLAKTVSKIRSDTGTLIITDSVAETKATLGDLTALPEL